MYAVVGCRECHALWVVEGRPDTTGCPRCGRRHQFKRLKRFATSEDADAARDARARLLAERSGHGDADLDDFHALGEAAEAPVLDDETFLRESGVDADAAAAAGERAERGTETGGQSRRETVLAALRELDDPTAEAVTAYATERGVPAAYVDRALEKLVRTGDVTEHRGTYRLL